MLKSFNNQTFVNRSTLKGLLDKLKSKLAKQSTQRCLDFDCGSMCDEDFESLTGVNRAAFDEICSNISHIVRNTPARTLRNSVGMFLFKMRSGLSNRILASLFKASRSSIRRAIKSVRMALVNSFVPQNLGLQHITREQVIENHTRPLAQTIFGSITSSPAILVLDGTYIYIQKSGNFKFQRRTFSMHKGRPLVKPMVIVTTTGYVLTVLGPYFADQRNNDASILTHMMTKNVENVKEWIQEDDVFVVDRGFRDSLDLLEDLGFKQKCPLS